MIERNVNTYHILYIRPNTRFMLPLHAYPIKPTNWHHVAAWLALYTYMGYIFYAVS